MFADTNDQLVLIGSSGCNLQYKPFCDWLTLIERTRHPSKIVQVFTFGDKRYLRLIGRQCKTMRLCRHFCNYCVTQGFVKWQQ